MPSLSQGHLLIYSGKPEEFRNRLRGRHFAFLDSNLSDQGDKGKKGKRESDRSPFNLY
jgi:hypothetical protein